MKIFVFGAGASTASQQIENLSEGSKAPLMRELFLDRYYAFAQEVGLPYNKFAELRDLAGDNVESYLTTRWEEIKTHRSQRYQEAENTLFGQMVFYIWRLLLAVSNTYNVDRKNSYGLFMHKIMSKDEDYGFINFNY